MPIYMSIAGFPGNSTAVPYNGWQELWSFSWGLEHGEARAAEFPPFNVMCAMDISAPKLMLACAQGLHIKTVIIAARKAGEKPVEYLRYTLEDVLISSYQQSQSSGEGGPPALAMSLNFTKITYKAAWQKPDGTLASQTNFWDRAGNVGG